MKNRQLAVAVLGGANYDYVIRGSRLPQPGETLSGDSFFAGAGGKGANQAVAVSRLGCYAFFVGQLGQDAPGEQTLAKLREEGVDIRFVSRDESEPTGVALIFVDRDGQKAIFSLKGANDTLTAEAVRAAEPTIREAQVLLLQLEVRDEVNQEAVRLAREAGIPVVLDPAPARELSDEFLAQITMIKPNATEAKVLTGVEVKDQASARRAAEMLLERGVEVVAVQAGDEGNLLVWADGEHFMPKLPVHSVDATGAGDAFAAALAVGLAEGWPKERIGEFANAAAALATTKLGAQTALPTRQEIAELIS